MATITQIRNLRIDVNDPPDIINITAAATPAALPTEPEPQTVYYITSTSRYVQTEKTSGAIPDDFKTVGLYLSDSKISALIDKHGYDKALYKALKLISAKLGSKLMLVKNQNGADSVEYLKLLDLYKYYKGLVADFKEEDEETNNNDTGRMGRSHHVHIAGGNL